MIDDNTSRQDLEVAILSDQDLYDSFDEAKLLDGKYTDDEMRAVIVAWIESGDECAA